MSLTSLWRGTVGLIKPNFRPGSTEDLIRLLPDGIGVIPLHIGINKGTRQQFEQSLPAYEEMVALCAELEADIIHPAGSPPFQVLGYQGEQELMRQWSKKYGRPVFTNGMTQVNALNAFNAKRLVGASYFRGDLNVTFGRYFEEAGFEVLALEGMDVDFDKAHTLSSTEVYSFIKALFLKHPGADAIYMLGPAWRTLDIIELLEQDLGVPVVHHLTAQSWEIQKRLHVRAPIKGRGRLLEEMP